MVPPADRQHIHCAPDSLQQEQVWQAHFAFIMAAAQQWRADWQAANHGAAAQLAEQEQTPATDGGAIPVTITGGDGAVDLGFRCGACALTGSGSNGCTCSGLCC